MGKNPYVSMVEIVYAGITIDDGPSGGHGQEVFP
jgi:hypothetical protein